MIPLIKPQLPTLANLEPYLKEIDINRVYSNFGPLVQEFHRRLEYHLQAPPGSIMTVANGTLGLALGLMALIEGKLDPEEEGVPVCLLPSWTFAASAAAVTAAGLQPYFLDVDAQSWALTPDIVDEALAQLSNFYKVKAVLTVAPFGAPWDPEQWDQWTERTGIPVIIDAAAGFDTLKITRSPVMVSLHATKVLGVGEGGIIGSQDLDFIQRLKRWTVFGFQGDRIASVPGINAKMPEYTAAVGLAALENWPKQRQAFMIAAQRYRFELSNLFSPQFKLQPEWGLRWISSTLNVFTPQVKAEVLQAYLQQQGIESRPWWRLPLHEHPAYKAYGQGSLGNTRDIAPFILGIPFFADISQEQIQQVCVELKHALKILNEEKR